MDFQNLTPLAALVYDVDLNDGEWHVVVARGTYDLAAAPAGEGAEGPRMTHVAGPSAGDTGLAFADEYFGEMNRSSVKHESDLAPKKPRCDVIVIGSAVSPSGEPAARVEIAIRIRREEAIPPFAEAGTRLEHRLVVHGRRAFVKKSGGWSLTEPEPFVAQPLRYEHAFGGELKVYAGDDAAPRLDDERLLRDEVRARHPEGEGAPVAHATCMQNPLGTGWLEAWYAEAARVERWPAPQIEAPGAPLTAEIFERMLRGEARPGELPELTPRGLGVVARPWQPRLARAGTLDDRWLAERWPAMPLDYDLAYWNCAHPDMQCDHLFGGELIELWNLLPSGAPGVAVEADGRTVCRFRLPDPVIVARLLKGEAEAWDVPRIDTLILDLDKMSLAIVWRLAAPAAEGIEGAFLHAVGDRRGAA